MSTRFWGLVICLFFTYVSKAQVITWNLNTETTSHSTDTVEGELSIRLNTSNFVKDNEYFNRMVEGYTFIGFWAEPTVHYAISKQTRIWAGVSGVRFFGRKGFYATEPIMGLQHNFTPHVSLTLGSLPFSQHGLPAPILDPERYYLRRVDNGAMILVNTSQYTADTWISWKRFSFYGDSLQELISAGTSHRLIIANMGYVRIELPVFGIITHRGGQVLRPKQPIETLVNAGSGLIITWTNEKLALEINPNFIIYRQLTSYPWQPFSKGWAVYPTIHFLYNRIMWESSWWHAQKFIAPEGEKIYALISTFDNYKENTRNLYINKLGYQTRFSDELQLLLAIESYYFPSEKRMDYNFWLHFNWFFARKIINLSHDRRELK